MEQGEIVQQDEFGGLEGLALPGQDPHRVEELIRLLTLDLNPVNLIERYWVRDIAILTARAEFLRKAHWAVMVRIVERLATRDVEQARLASEDKEQVLEEARSALDLVRQVRQGAQGPAASLDPRWQSLLGEAFMTEIALIDKLTQLEFMVLRERDRILKVRDQRHAKQVRELIHEIESGILKEAGYRLEELSAPDAHAPAAA